MYCLDYFQLIDEKCNELVTSSLTMFFMLTFKSKAFLRRCITCGKIISFYQIIVLTPGTSSQWFKCMVVIEAKLASVQRLKCRAEVSGVSQCQ